MPNDFALSAPVGIQIRVELERRAAFIDFSDLGVIDSETTARPIEETAMRGRKKQPQPQQQQQQLTVQKSASSSSQNLGGPFPFAASNSTSSVDRQHLSTASRENTAPPLPEDESTEVVKPRHRPAPSFGPVSIETFPGPESGPSTSTSVESVDFFSGNPLVERTSGVIHFFKKAESAPSTSRCICLVGVPTAITARDFLQLFGEDALRSIRRIKVIRTGQPNHYMLLILFHDHESALQFYSDFNGVAYEGELSDQNCLIVFVDECKSAFTDDWTKGLAAEEQQLVELPTCAVCLERLDDQVLTILCNHSFHASCMYKVTESSCPVCRYTQTPEVEASTFCADCGRRADLWICLICGNIGCGRYAEAHAYRHFEATAHTFTMQVGGERVWDYAGDNYVHRLIQTDTDGKLVEYARAGGALPEMVEGEEKAEAIRLEYTCLLSTQLAAQRDYFERRVADAERLEQNARDAAKEEISVVTEQLHAARAGAAETKKRLDEATQANVALEKKLAAQKQKVQKLSDELTDERALNATLRADQKRFTGLLDEEKKRAETVEKRLTKEVADLREQLSDLMMHFEAMAKVEEQKRTGQLTAEDVEGASIELGQSTTTAAGRRRSGNAASSRKSKNN